MKTFIAVLNPCPLIIITAKRSMKYYKKCLSQFTNGEKCSMLKLFSEMESKGIQDIHLQRLMEILLISKKKGNR